MPPLPKKYADEKRIATLAPFWVKESKPSIRLFSGPCEEVLIQLPDSSVDMVFADPPYNIGYNYDLYDDSRPAAGYVAWVERWLYQLARVVRPGGAVWVMCHSSYFGTFEKIVDLSGLIILNRVIWRYTFGQNQRDRFTPSWVPLFYCIKPPLQSRMFNSEAIRIPSARQLKYKDKRANPIGKVPDDVWDDIPRLVGNAKERVGHPCQLPLEVVRRAVLACTSEGQTVLDPFVGSGTTPAVCLETNRNCMGMELSENYLTTYTIPRLVGV